MKPLTAARLREMKKMGHPQCEHIDTGKHEEEMLSLLAEVLAARRLLRLYRKLQNGTCCKDDQSVCTVLRAIQAAEAKDHRPGPRGRKKP